MGKCNVCGKKGLFFRVNCYGRCKSCQSKYEDEEREKAKQKERERKQLEMISRRNKETLAKLNGVDKKSVVVAQGNKIKEDGTRTVNIGDTFAMVPDCVIIDIETSGLVYNRNSIIEIAAIKVVDEKVQDVYSSLIHRERPLDRKITMLTGITTNMLQECVSTLDIVMYEFRSFIGDLPLVGHNINSFDIKFINEAYLKVFGQPIENECIDTLRLSYEHFVDADSHKLAELACYAKTTRGVAHRALGDCETTLYLYERIQKQAASQILKWSKNGKGIKNETYPKYVINSYCNGGHKKAHEELIAKGYLKPAHESIVLNTFLVEDLKNILIQHSLDTRGKKAVLISRIINDIDVRSLDLPVMYIPSEKGLIHMEQYKKI